MNNIKSKKVKSAKTKVSILNSTIRLIDNKSFKNVALLDICKEAKISKVTFFKYFPQKEHVLLYYERIWCLDKVVKLADNGYEDLKAIQFIFNQMTISYAEHPGLILSLIGLLISQEKPFTPSPIKSIEKELLFTNVPNIGDYDLLSIPQMFEKHLLEAVFKGKIRHNGNVKELSHIFLSSLFGNVIVCHLRRADSLQMMYKRSLECIIKGLNSSK